jgi:hypothetical protein
MQAGFVIDIAAGEVFHIQPGLMYIQKGMKDRDGTGITTHNVELPLLISLKFSALRLNAGPYFAWCIDSPEYRYYNNMGWLGGTSRVFDAGGFDMGLSAGIGFDIGMFYIGMFYDYGLLNTGNWGDLYNRTLGFNLGVNL